jgi:nucleotide-binding universal stress UspA family protein
MKILIGYRGENVGVEQLRIAAQHATAFDAEVDIVTSLPGGDKTSTEDVQIAEGRLSFAEETLSSQGIRCRTHLLVRGFSPGEDLVAFAEENKVDEIIIGVKRRSKVGKMLFGSTAQFVILHAGCPVLSVK